MKDIDVKELIEKVETIAVDQKVVERKAFWDYLLDKRESLMYVRQ